jgi:alkyl hydroperoxide reductase subunit F
MYDLIVIGGGPAGLTAAIYAIRKRLNVLMISRDLGGKTNYRLALPWIEEYQVIRGLETVARFRNELEYLDFARSMEKVEHIRRENSHFVVETKEGEDKSTRAIIIATGARQARLKVPGEEKYMMRGLCYSAISYAPLFIDRTTTVIGNADLALRSAAELALVARQVNLVGPPSNALESGLGKKLLNSEHVTIYQDYELVQVNGGKFAESVVIQSPNGELKEIPSDGAFIEMRLLPNSYMVEGLVNLDAQGRIIIDCQNRTSTPGIFAAGDVTNTTEQVLVAIGEGAKAALSAYEYLLPML